jgi:deoxyribonucleoside regulator
MKERDELLMRVVELYYQQGLNQNKVAGVVGISRPMVSRLLIEARNKGIVEIKVHSKINKNSRLSLKIRDTFGLQDATIISGNYNYNEAIQKCGAVASEFLYSILDNNMTIGITWGPMINSLCDSLQEKQYYNVHVLQMVGSLGTGNPLIDGIELAYRISSKLNGTYSNIISPAFVDNEFVQEYLFNQPQIKSIINMANNLDVVLTGIGSVSDNRSTLRVAGYLTESDVKELTNNGCVGHVAARFFDDKGNEILLKDHYPIAVPLDALKNARKSIGICASASRAAPVIAAIKSSFINTLIADEALANEMLDLTDK